MVEGIVDQVVGGGAAVSTATGSGLVKTRNETRPSGACTTRSDHDHASIERLHAAQNAELALTARNGPKATGV